MYSFLQQLDTNKVCGTYKTKWSSGNYGSEVKGTQEVKRQQWGRWVSGLDSEKCRCSQGEWLASSVLKNLTSGPYLMFIPGKACWKISENSTWNESEKLGTRERLSLHTLLSCGAFLPQDSSSTSLSYGYFSSSWHPFKAGLSANFLTFSPFLE